jgi:hypothetical protein
VVLIGTSLDPSVTRFNNAVWEWDGTDWTDRSSLATSIDAWDTFQAAPAWDADRRQLVMKGTAVTITSDGTHWRSQPANGREPLGGESPMVFDTVRHQLVLFDGTITWTWDGTRWLQLTEDGSPALAAIVTDPVHQVVLGLNTEWNSRLLALWRWDRRAWVPLPATNAPPGRAEFGLAYDSTRERLVLFGGTDNGNAVLAETWEFDGTTWERRLPEHSPPARKSPSMAFDPVRQRVVVYGGQTPMALGDAWEWNGFDWQPLSNAGAPSARYAVPMIWDATHARLLLIGNPLGVPGVEAFSWDGAWTDVTPAMPPARPIFVRSMAEDPQRQVVLAVEPVSFSVMGTWEFTAAGWTQRMPVVSPGTNSFPGAAWDPVGQHVLISGVGQTWIFVP